MKYFDNFIKINIMIMMDAESKPVSDRFMEIDLPANVSEEVAQLVCTGDPENWVSLLFSNELALGEHWFMLPESHVAHVSVLPGPFSEPTKMVNKQSDLRHFVRIYDDFGQEAYVYTDVISEIGGRSLKLLISDLETKQGIRISRAPTWIQKVNFVPTQADVNREPLFSVAPQWARKKVEAITSSTD